MKIQTGSKWIVANLNPNHDEQGRFAADGAGGGGGGSSKGAGRIEKSAWSKTDKADRALPGDKNYVKLHQEAALAHHAVADHHLIRGNKEEAKDARAQARRHHQDAWREHKARKKEEERVQRAFDRKDKRR